ncbi:MAG: AMP-binding protein [Phycisphaerales bacterium JB052]
MNSSNYPSSSENSANGDTRFDNFVAVLAINSVDFVRTVFGLYAKQQPFVILKNRDQLKDIPGIKIVRVIEPEAGSGWVTHDPIDFPNADVPAQVTFTSGTEGKPKGIVLSHRALCDVVHRLRDISNIDGSICEYVGVPAGYSFGLGRYRVCAAVGGRTYLPPRGFDPTEIAQMLRDGQINAISAVPTLWKTVLANPQLFEDLGHKVMWIEIGSQYMSRADKEHLKELFPEATIIQHYGLTEASRSTFLDISSTEGDALESVGRATGETQVRISSEGLIEVRGPHVAMGQLTEHGIEPIVHDGGWLTTKDRGELRDGYIYYLGRNDDLINCGGIKLPPDHLERDILKLLKATSGVGVGRFAHPLRGDGIVVALEKGVADDLSQVQKAITALLEEQGLRVGDALRVIELDQLPRTETGKIQRSRLAGALTEYDRTKLKTDSSRSTGLANDTSCDEIEESDLQNQLIDIWSRVLNSDDISLDENFYSSGGDSLSAISMMLALEKAGIDKKITAQIFDGNSIREIVRAEAGHELVADKPKRMNERVTGDSINIVRGLLVLILISIHFLPGVLERLPVDSEYIGSLLHPYYRLGTPGFALVFGLGVGYFYFYQMSNSRAHVWRRVRLSAIIVSVGIVIQAIFRFGSALASPDPLPSPFISSMFYSVLIYYLLAVLSIPIWFKIIYNKYSPVLFALTAAVGSYLIYLILNEAIGTTPLSFGPAELARLMLEAKYNYFRMTGIVMIGVAIGLHYRYQANLDRAAGQYLLAGALLTMTMLMLTYDMGSQLDRWLTMRDAELFAILGYTGLVLMMLGIVSWLRPMVGRSGFWGFSLRVLAACGVLSLPSYVAHGLVIPAKDIAVGFTPVPDSIALLGSLGLFFIVAFFAVRKVVRLYG